MSLIMQRLWEKIDNMDGVIVFLMGYGICFGIWYGKAWLDRREEDRQREKREKQNLKFHPPYKLFLAKKK